MLYLKQPSKSKGLSHNYYSSCFSKIYLLSMWMPAEIQALSFFLTNPGIESPLDTPTWLDRCDFFMFFIVCCWLLLFVCFVWFFIYPPLGELWYSFFLSVFSKKCSRLGGFFHHLVTHLCISPNLFIFFADAATGKSYPKCNYCFGNFSYVSNTFFGFCGSIIGVKNQSIF